MTGSTPVGGATALLVVGMLVALRAVVRRKRAARVARRLPVPPGERRAWRARFAPPGWLVGALDDAGIEHPPESVFAWSLAGGGAAALSGAFAGGLVLGVLLPVLAGAVAATWLVALRGRGDRRYESSVPLALDLLSRSLRAGASLHQAIGEATAGVDRRVAADLASIAAAASMGQPLVTAVEAWADRRPLSSVRLAAAALCLGAETGGAHARAIDGVASTLREHLALQSEVRALTSQARTSALVIAVAPVAFCAVTVVTDAASATFLLRTPLGLAMLTTGLLLDAVAAGWMHRLTARITA